MKLSFLKQRTINFILLAISVSVFATIFFLWKAPVFNAQKFFYEKSIAVNSYDLFDIGVTDINRDGNLDIFSANHSAAQNLLINDGRGNFTEMISEWKLNQDSNFSGLEASLEKPTMEKPGLYIYRMGVRQSSAKDAYTALVIEAHGLAGIKQAQGNVSLSSSVNWSMNGDFQVGDVDQVERDTSIRTTIPFSVEDKGTLSLNHPLVALPVSMEIDHEFPLSSIYIGAQKLQPSSHLFTLHWRDRHGMAWADYNADGNMDVFISRGGLRGELIASPESFSDDFFNDELLANDGEKFVNLTLQAGVEKQGCPGRQTSWVDINNDQLLDLYLVCGKGAPPGNLVPNQLYQQQQNGLFVEVGDQYNIAHPEQGVFTWLDIDLDGDSDFVWVTKEEFQFYVNQGDTLKLAYTIPNSQGKVKKLAIADFDSDGDFDIFGAQARGTSLLINEQGTYKKARPEHFGLPNEALTINWVDYDNDGLVDLHAIPSGLYRQRQDKRFTKTGLLAHKASLSPLEEARAAWFDFDNDGTRDALIAYKYRPWWLRVSSIFNLERPDSRNWEARLYRNIGSKKNWLEIELMGLNNNPQALGSRVQVTTPNGVQLEHVGQLDGSHYSQGHYRLYFGLGKYVQAEKVNVSWPDGTVQTLSEPNRSGLLKIVHPEQKS